MPPKKNPLGLNALQLKTLNLAQALARLDDIASPDESEPGAVKIDIPLSLHGDHMHIGGVVLSGRDAAGLKTPGVWAALERKKLSCGNDLTRVVLTSARLVYDTGLPAPAFHHADH